MYILKVFKIQYISQPYMFIFSNPLLFVIFCQNWDEAGGMHMNCSACSVNKVNPRTSISPASLKKPPRTWLEQ